MCWMCLAVSALVVWPKLQFVMAGETGSPLLYPLAAPQSITVAVLLFSPLRAVLPWFVKNLDRVFWICGSFLCCHQAPGVCFTPDQINTKTPQVAGLFRFQSRFTDLLGDVFTGKQVICYQLTSCNSFFPVFTDFNN